MIERVDCETGEEQELPRLDLAEAIAQTRREWKDAAAERAGRHFAEIYGIEMDFRRRNESLIASGDRMSQKEFERWEDTVADELDLAEKEIGRVEMKLADKAEIMQNMIAYREGAELRETVEAQSGKYYVERDNELRLAIRKDGGASTEKDLAYLNGFYSVVATHLDYKHTDTGNIQGYSYEVYKRQCMEACDDTIRYLNGMNHLARKYGTRTFTPRDFWTSDLCSENAQTPAISAVMRYDRDIVEEYYAIAFKKEIEKTEPQFDKSDRHAALY